MMRPYRAGKDWACPSMTSVAGVSAGNVIKDVQLSIVAAVEGARAEFGINRTLAREDFERRAWGCSASSIPL